MARGVQRIKSDAQIQTIIMRNGSPFRRQMISQGKVAARFYKDELRRHVFQYEVPGYPFARHEDQRSVLDIPSVVKVVGNSIVIANNAPSAQFIEEGNKPPGGGDYIRSKKGNPLAILGHDGRVYLMHSVHVSRIDFGRPLHKAVLKAYARFRGGR